MLKRLFHMFLFISACMAIIFILLSPMYLFHIKDTSTIRSIIAKQKIAPQRLFISSWRNIKQQYYDKSMNNQDWNKWKYKYLKYIKTDEDVIVAVNTMLASLDDDFSEFFGKKKYELQENYIKGNSDTDEVLKITPATVQLDVIAGFVKSAKVVQASKYYKNLQEGDIVISIDNYLLENTEMNSAVNLIRGRSPISKYEILRDNKKMTVSVVRNAVTINKISAKIIDDDIAYISIYSLMGKNAPSTFNNYIQSYSQANGLIIDLRGDVGGLFVNAIYIADEFINKGELIKIKNREGNQVTLKATPLQDEIKKPIVILINKQTASSSEILAGILKSNNKAVLVGMPSFGKNTIQQIIQMPNSSCINLTMAKYNFGNGFEPENGVLVPDYYVDIMQEDVLSGRDPQLKKAIEVIKKMNKE